MSTMNHDNSYFIQKFHKQYARKSKENFHFLLVIRIGFNDKTQPSDGTHLEFMKQHWFLVLVSFV